MAKFWLVTAAISGFLAVALGALGAHALRNGLDSYGTAIYGKAVLYHLFHTLALLAVGILQSQFKNSRFDFAGWGFLAGIILFSGSLYALAVTGAEWLVTITPFGGLAFLAGWLWLAYAVAKVRE